MACTSMLTKLVTEFFELRDHRGNTIVVFQSIATEGSYRFAQYIDTTE